MLSEPPPQVEETPAPAVSSLRSKFEKLAVESSSTTSLNRLSMSQDLLTPDSGSPRPRAMSIPDERPPSSPHSLRSASSSSDLKKKQPPPPPPRSSKGSSPAPSATSSPHVYPVPMRSEPPSPTHTAPPNRVALLHRKPPPPPSPAPSRDLSPASKESGIASLISKFGNAVPTAPRNPTPRIASHSGASVLTNDPSARVDAQRTPRHSLPLSIPPYASTPLIQLDGPFDGEEAPSSRPPPLPHRRNGAASSRNPSPEHDRSASSESLGTLSSTSSGSDGYYTSVVSSPLKPITHLPPPPPPPPPRPKSSTPTSRQSSLASVQSSTPSTSCTPPPLPARRGTAQSPAHSPDDSLTRRVPPPPRHRSLNVPPEVPPRTSSPAVDLLQDSPVDGPPTASPPAQRESTQPAPPSERKTFGTHLPPPTRTIAPGEKLPPARRPPPGSGSSSDEEEEELKVKVELLPDASRASRRPPVLGAHVFSDSNIYIPAYVGIAVATGFTVASAQGHHIRIYDLSHADTPVHDLDARALGMETKMKDFKITSIEFRASHKETDHGRFLWIGTKDGHLFELDIQAGVVCGMKLAIHSHAVTHIFRYGQAMVTLDETGKALVFVPEAQGEADVLLAHTPARVVRVADRQEFAKVLAGRLWASTRDSTNSNTASTSRGPIVRVYDVFTPGTAGKSLLPPEHLGAVTSGTVLPTQPHRVFLGHEGGNVSIWALDTEDGVPACDEVVKVSTSDILSLEGVNDRLWAGARNGMIAAFDVTLKPWVMTNRWMAHQGLPVLRLAIDTWSIQKLGKLAVYSVGRDERIRFWDGLLGADWIDQELMKREHEFSSFRDLNVLVVSWNLDSQKPDALVGAPENVNFLHEVLTSVDAPDIIAFGLQELIDLESRKMAAKTVLLGGKNRNPEGALSQRVTTSYKKWYDKLVQSVRLALPADSPYYVIHTENLVGLFSCIFVKDTLRPSLRHAALTTVKRGMGGRYGNKGGIICRFVVDDTSICFINCHLAAGQSHVRQRNADIAAFLEDRELFASEVSMLEEPVAFINGGDGSMVLDHEIVFLNGDMNYRIDLRRDAAVADVKAGNFQHLMAQDQLLKEMKLNRGFRLRTFMEGPLHFAPTYKYDRRSDEYDTSEKRRVPAWCDRVLWRSREPSRVHQLHYRRWEPNVSDHRPVSAAFRVQVKAVDSGQRHLVKHETEAHWFEYEKVLLSHAYQFYTEQGLI
ncbi:uncharacterized protein PHACADRAFT_249089 [Phanerochaete carnosa HHB-10118-sp]|uniref:Inositol polyphosphate-related phosphatase domain-containing protein n=1 Tax=Phanerochaete carnosa (strain HHB-10118-sp) TaxID=650164 RepID=K5V849_PHACS|nr:uncharacterized protein PHACADRAFT_249089 [Phanerochaete carnosa HHB-10118-sp]EKM58956.1 hypothetical protein PHACADRAFT_249089 [Phanerochaete carnosa HHB-10118-sp]